jgi:competence protein ComEC
MAGMQGEAQLIADYPGARCNADFCALEVQRGPRIWRLLLARGTDPAPERALAAACERVDIVIASRWLPQSCRPAWLKADRNLLERSGGLAIDLTSGTVTTVAQSQGQHGWWQVPDQRRPEFSPSGAATDAANPAPQ